jgi:hypothetical protein
LKLAARARNLLILEQGPEDLPRSFFSAEGLSVFEELRGRARVLKYENVVEEVESWPTAAGGGT